MSLRGVYTKARHTARPGGWRRRASCRAADPVDFELFGRYLSDANREVIARHCKHCAVRRDCLDEALAQGDWGVIRGGIPLWNPAERATCEVCRKSFVRARRTNTAPRRTCSRVCYLDLQSRLARALA